MAGSLNKVMLIGNLGAIPQSNFKRLLAYSSISHAGFLLLALAAGEPAAGLTPNVVVSFYLGTYLLMTLLSFLIMVIVRNSSANDDLSAFDGLSSRSPFLAFALLIAAASLAGVPLTAGFFGKFFAILLAAGTHHWFLLALAVLGAAAGFYYYFKIVRSMYWNAPAADAPALSYTALSRASIVLLTALTLLLGVYPKPLLALLQ